MLFSFKLLTSISIHALRGEGDRRLNSCGLFSFDFNPRPPRGGRLLPVVNGSRTFNFNPRPPRGGRPSATTRSTRTGYFNPRPPRGGRQQKCTNFIYGFFMIYKLSRKPTHFIPIIKYFFAHFFKKHDAFPVRKPAGFDVSMNFALKH